MSINCTDFAKALTIFASVKLKNPFGIASKSLWRETLIVGLSGGVGRTSRLGESPDDIFMSTPLYDVSSKTRFRLGIRPFTNSCEITSWLFVGSPIIHSEPLLRALRPGIISRRPGLHSSNLQHNRPHSPCPPFSNNTKTKGIRRRFEKFGDGGD